LVWSRRGLLVTAATALLLAPARTALAAPDRPDTGAGTERVGARLRELERAYGGRIGAFAVNTATGAVAGHRAAEPFPLLSTFKALAAAAVLHTARHRDHGLLDRVIHWTSADLVDYSPITGQHVDTGLTVAQLCEAAVTVSDNTAGNLLLRQLGGPHGITRFARRLGDHATSLDRWEPELNDWTPTERRDLTTPAAAGRDLLALTVRDALVPQDRDRLIGWLQGSLTGGARIRAGARHGADTGPVPVRIDQRCPVDPWLSRSPGGSGSPAPRRPPRTSASSVRSAGRRRARRPYSGPWPCGPPGSGCRPMPGNSRC
jgi:beta-lactamase class A